MKSGIYEIVNTTNGNRYVGSAIDFKARFWLHRYELKNAKHGNRHLQSAWNKYGASCFRFKRILICASQHLLLYEQIALDALNPKYNICRVAGNSLGVKWTIEAKENLKVSLRNRPNDHFLGRKHTPETLKKMSLALIGNTRTRGKRRSPEAVAKTAAAHKGMKRSAETRAKISASKIGKPYPKSESHRTALSAALRGRITCSPEAIARMAATKRGSKLSAEHKARIGDASRAAWALRKANAK